MEMDVGPLGDGHGDGDGRVPTQSFGTPPPLLLAFSTILPYIWMHEKEVGSRLCLTMHYESVCLTDSAAT